ncbi:hypothetical protein IWW38_005174 [Coemansia aciculifera]|uniref:Uncharacterized protein n=1 Tax=Coemansia aciculifera TaxID=417176 RepID=A0ACC1LXA1_9FUNG|nr:hypothetical protein IWW38_005174 [Coemansia aciculifera]
MKFAQSLLALAAGLSAIVAGSETTPNMRRLFRRADNSVATSDINGFKGAVLLKNGVQTSCEVALMRNTYGFVAAACLDFTDTNGKVVNTTTVYSVAITAGNQTPYGTVQVNRVTVNPQFDPKSFANNLAVLEFNGGGAGYDFVNYIASWRPDWTSFEYVRRSLINGLWNMPTVVPYTQSSTDLANCASNNKLFLLNQNDLLCNQLTAPSASMANCSAAPLGSVYGVNGANMAIAALYSHSAISGGSSASVCGSNGSSTYHYYIVMENYVHWAMSVLNTRVPVYHTYSSAYTENFDVNYSMVIPPQPVDISGVTVMGGDIFRVKTEAAQESKSTSSGPSAVVIVALVLGLLLLLALAFYLYRRRQKNKKGEDMTRVRAWWHFGRRASNFYN